MHFNDYYYVAAIAEHRSISKAAEALYISQPYLSKFLAKLEAQYDACFFDRASYPLTLTFAGKCYLDYATKILNLEKELKTVMEDAVSGNIGALAIGVAPITSSFIMPYVYPMFIKRYPGIQLRLTEINSRQLLKTLQEGKLDLTILNRPDYPDGILYEHIIDERILLAVPPSHEIIKYAVPGSPYPVIPKQYMSRLSGAPFILNLPEQSLGAFERQILNSNNIQPNVILTTQTIQTAYRLTAQGVGFSFVNEMCLYGVQFNRKPVLLQMGDPCPTRPLVAAYRKETYVSESMAYFIQCLLKVGQGYMKEYNGIYGI